MKNLIFFDLETQKSDKEVGGWENKRDMLVSVAVTFSTADGYYHTYMEEDVDALIKELTGADMVIGFNIKNFDYAVLSHYTEIDFSSINSLDLMEAVVQNRGHRVGLDNLARATLGTEKLYGSGLDAIKLFQGGKIFELIEYCKQDVKITKELYEYGVENGFVFFTDYNGTKIKVPVKWGTE
jgi:DEAD/DEAH box helicase domain-containing protein